MANDDSLDARNPDVDVAAVAEKEVAGEGRGVVKLAERDPASVSVKDLIRLLHDARDTALIPVEPLPTDVRIARLERRSVELEWVVYGLLGLFFAMWLLRR